MVVVCGDSEIFPLLSLKNLVSVLTAHVKKCYAEDFGAKAGDAQKQRQIGRKGKKGLAEFIVRHAVIKGLFSGAVTGKAGKYYGLDNGAWVKDLGDEKYQTDWTGEERWGRVEALETDETGAVSAVETLGFILLRVDRSRGLL